MHRLLIIIAGAVAFALSYSEAAHSAPDRPVVFIPGILGSKLCEGNTTIWGDTRSFSNFNKLQIKFDASPKTIKSCGLVEAINLLGPFWTIHQYDQILSNLKDLGYVEDDGKLARNGNAGLFGTNGLRFAPAHMPFFVVTM